MFPTPWFLAVHENVVVDTSDLSPANGVDRVECRENQMLWRNEGDTDGQRRNARLLIRTYLRLFRPNENDTACRQRVDGICSCSRQHFRQLEASTNPLDGAELTSLQIAKHVLRLHTKF